MIYNVQALRAIAALLVTFVHLDKLLPAVGLPPFGAIGVELFFVISGFIMVFTTSRKPVTGPVFLANRLIRIVPIYWTITLAVFCVALVAPRLLLATNADATELLLSLTFLPYAKSNGQIEPVLFVGWTLNYEMFFYVLFAIGLTAPNKLYGRLGVIIALIGLVGLGWELEPNMVSARFYTDSTLLLFGAGMLIAMTLHLLPMQVTAWAKLVALGVVMLALIAGILRVPLSLTDSLALLVASATVAGAIWLERWGWAVRGRWVLLLGDASYAIYLTHPFVTQSAQKLVGPHPSVMIAVVMIIGTTVMVCLVGIAVHLMIETRLTAVVRSLVSGPIRLPVTPRA